MITAPVGVFGLAPQGKVALLSSRAETDLTNTNGRHTITTEYTVNAQPGAAMLLPFSATNPENPLTILLDGKPVKVTESRLPFAGYRQAANINDYTAGNPLSIQVSPEFLEGIVQPENTYSMLLEGYRTNANDWNLAPGTKMRVYDVTGLPESERLQIVGPEAQLWFVVSEGCEVTSSQQIGGSSDVTSALPRYNTYHNTYTLRTGGKKTLLVTRAIGGGSNVGVSVGDDGLTYREITLREVFAECLGTKDADMETMMTSLTSALTGEVKSGQICMLKDNFKHTIRDELRMMRFELPAGKHTIRVTQPVSPGNGRDGTRRLQYIAAPDSLWTSVGERSLALRVGENLFTYPVEKSVNDIVLPVDKTN